MHAKKILFLFGLAIAINFHAHPAQAAGLEMEVGRVVSETPP